MIKILFLALIVALFGYFFIGRARPAENIIWGVNFSQKHAKKLGLNWKETYSALLNDLGARNIKIAAHWDLIEPEQDNYSFDDLDWQIEKASLKEAKILLVVGMKTPRWPECHIPFWAENLSKQKQQEEILNLLEAIVKRYKEKDALWAWQVENEPFFPFGDCPWRDKAFLKKEIELVKSLDSRPIIISDTGEFSLWFRSAKLADIVGTTMYRNIWSKELSFYIRFPFPSVFYWRKAQLVKMIYAKEVINVELQAEPWGPALLYDSSLKEQEKTMNLEEFKKNVKFAEKSGLGQFYFWGAEWWYWLKTEKNQPQIWEEARKLF